MLLIFLALSSRNPALGGECLGSTEDYFQELKAISKENISSKIKRRNMINTLSCLYNDGSFRVANEYPEDFASLSAIKQIKEETKRTKQLCFRVIPEFLKSSSPEVRCEAVNVLAYYGWPGSFELLMRCDGMATRKATLFAILGDKRAIPWIINQYKNIDKEERGKPVIYLKMVYLNALYHLASPLQLAFIEDLIRKPNPAEIKQRAQKVKNHINQLYPKLRNARFIQSPFNQIPS